MWTGYFRIKKAIDITAGDVTNLLAMGSAQTPNYPNLRTCVRVSIDDREAIIELESAVEPIEGDVPFGVTEFAVFAGACWCDRCTDCNDYIITNVANWET